MADAHHEYIVKQKTEGSLLTKKILLITLYAVLPLFAFGLAVLLFYGSFLLIPSCILGIGVDVLLIFFTWRFTRVEFETSIEQSTLTITTIKAGSHRRLSLELDIKSFSEVGLFTAEVSDELEKASFNKDYIFISSLDSESIYYGIFNEDKERCIVYFETSHEGYAHIKKINSLAARRSENITKRGMST